ncbi:MAG TPA: gamma-glutamyl-gamma-aminobutyrate hydrolase family protein [Syntrophothermus lipocalidus]|uniref:Peptidase C26 n=1 Tax=Syntrophothermus lipocalidus (strain DSM 12680 / TGB-C1) TaxID=643648 RepID=D7CPA1_SYNLT|nr:gamma-glutamyl-gamma-aminobutyrate hydrolase family protein [Syntrophothermus lipocalidus]ADI02536.1 peptidase C26 [Syntrophothermus lipocalidus DSM 12680]HHV76447.1 gamma-glutamyl-gamma-aminobutyrate hydrolase family protein [Syntrophothermus lipocalidus]HOV43036.1 gamma-glutamyl-gamma-aminobutyrate hydrolase family protein [Syntrophothermus lipocalidus]
MGVRIGITCSFEPDENRHYLRRDYIDKILNAGGVPVILPPTNDRDVITEYKETCHGLLLAGGGDVDPVNWGEEPHPDLGTVDPTRDEFELALMKCAMEEDLPVLGICRGAQVINVAFGGSLYQHLAGGISHQQKAPPSHAFHGILVVRDTRLYRISGSDTLRVNSFHHQAVREIGENLIISATACDGVIEAVESVCHRFILGVQWHPELMTDKVSENLFKALVDAGRERIKN